MNSTVSTTLARHLADSRSAWVVGVMGAAAEFIHDGSPTELGLDGARLRTPHTHVLPDRLRRTPPFETPVPVPYGMLCCLELYAPDAVFLAEGLGMNPHD